MAATLTNTQMPLPFAGRPDALEERFMLFSFKQSTKNRLSLLVAEFLEAIFRSMIIGQNI